MVDIAHIAINYAILFGFILTFCLLFLSAICCCMGCRKNDDMVNEKNKYFKKRFDVIKYNTVYTSDRASMVSTIRGANSGNKSFGIDKDIASKLDAVEKTKKNNTARNASPLTPSSFDQYNVPTEKNVKKKETKQIDVDLTGKIERNENKCSIVIDDFSNTHVRSEKDVSPTRGSGSASPTKIHQEIRIHSPAKYDGECVSHKEVYVISAQNDETNTMDIEAKIYLHYSFDNMNEEDDNSATTVLGNINDESKNVFRDLEAFVNIVLKTMDPNEVVILLKISSPGGYAYKFELAYTHLLRLRDTGFQMIALVDDICASGGYMLASACHTIVCSEYANIGSVGVTTSLYNYYGLCQKIGLVEKTLTTGPYKRPFPAGEPFEQKDVDRVDELIHDSLVVFKDIVQKARSLTELEMKELLSARVWYGRKALEKKMVDVIMSSNEYLDYLDKDKNQIFLVCRRPTKNKTSLQSLFEMSVNQIPQLIVKLTNSMMKNMKPARQNIYMNNYSDDHFHKIL